MPCFPYRDARFEDPDAQGLLETGVVWRLGGVPERRYRAMDGGLYAAVAGEGELIALSGSELRSSIADAPEGTVLLTKDQLALLVEAGLRWRRERSSWIACYARATSPMHGARLWLAAGESHPERPLALRKGADWPVEARVVVWFARRLCVPQQPCEGLHVVEELVTPACYVDLDEGVLGGHVLALDDDFLWEAVRTHAVLSSRHDPRRRIELRPGHEGFLRALHSVVTGAARMGERAT